MNINPKIKRFGMKKHHVIRKYLFDTAWIILFLLLAGCQPQPAAEETETTISEKAETTRKDMGKKPWVLNIEQATVDNHYYRDVKWTGDYMQMVFMSLKPGEIIDLELHEDIDQFIRIEQGKARVMMGETKENLLFDKTVSDDWAIFIPAGYWHEIRNIGDIDLKLYSIYTPSEHPSGTRHETYQEAEAYEHDH
jgi:mannose-6-phosphate isomerase-like protein (cupin superfamily)